VNQLQQVASLLVKLTLIVAVGVFAWWLVTNKPTVPKAEKPAPAASVPKVVKEEELNVVRVTEAAMSRLGIQLGSVEQKPIRRHRIYGGEVTIPVGRTILVAAPLSGTLKPTAQGLPKAGDTVQVGQPLLQLLPLLTPDTKAALAAALTDADGLVNNAKTQLELAKVALERAKKVLREGAGSQRQVDESQAAHDNAKITYDAALARQNILKKVIGDADTGASEPIVINAPETGIVRTISALPGQIVQSGAALFEMIDLSTVWVRVPLPVSDLDSIDRQEEAQVGKLTATSQDQFSPAKATVAPPTANPIAGTVDSYYEVLNSKKVFTPGQRIGVRIPLKGSATGLTVPWSAIVFDVHGSTWIYEERAAREFVRRRVTVQYTLGQDAVLETGPSAGIKVVTAGVQELFGSETGFVK
jgi:membrane fusion protein, heavy metal efflux system